MFAKIAMQFSILPYYLPLRLMKSSVSISIGLGSGLTSALYWFRPWSSRKSDE